MAVLVEAISVIARRERIDAVYPGGWDGFERDCPNATLCADAHLARVGFMAPEDVGTFMEGLIRKGLVFLHRGEAQDFVVVDQLSGPTSPCHWIEVRTVKEFDGGMYNAASLKDAEGDYIEVATPDGWHFEGSLSAQHSFVASDDVASERRFLRRENGLEVYLDESTGQEVYVGRTDQGH